MGVPEGFHCQRRNFEGPVVAIGVGLLALANAATRVPVALDGVEQAMYGR